jgi:hypothetical protein
MLLALVLQPDRRPPFVRHAQIAKRVRAAHSGVGESVRPARMASLAASTSKL